MAFAKNQKKKVIGIKLKLMSLCLQYKHFTDSPVSFAPFYHTDNTDNNIDSKLASS